jgi:hypothetical protein
MKKIGMILFLSLIAKGMGAQEIGEKQDLTIFDISYFKADLDPGVVNSVDTEISQVFINLGRFNVIGMEFRLDAADVTDFAEQVKNLKESTTQLPDEVRFGDAYFTLEDFNKLVGSFIIVIPQITSYSNEYSEGRYRAFVETSFTFLNAQNMEAFAAFKIETEGSDEDSATLAANSAINAMPAQLYFEIRKIPEFQLKTAVLDVEGKEVIIQMGEDFGLQPGDEFTINKSVTTRIGRALQEEIGQIIIKQVGADFSTAYLLFGEAFVGSGAQEYPRYGVDLVPMVGIGYRYGVEEGQSASHFSLALTAIQSRGAFDSRVFATLEIPSLTSLIVFIPLTLTVGVQNDAHFDRLMTSWYLGGSLGAAYPWLFDAASDADELADKIQRYMTHIGLRGGVKASMLFGKDWRVGGFAQLSGMYALPGTRFVRDLAKLAGIGDEFLSFFQTYGVAEVGLEVVYKY